MSKGEYQSIMISFREAPLHSKKLSVNLFSYKRWKTLIHVTAENLKSKYTPQKSFISDLQTIGKSIPEHYLIQATIGIKSFKPEFLEQKPILQSTTVSTLSQTIIQAAKYKSEGKCCDISLNSQAETREKTFSNQFNKKSHPFRFMIKNMLNLLELKYKAQIDHGELSVLQLQKKIKIDIQVCVEFLLQIAQPYKQLFDHQDEQENQKLCSKFDSFFLCFVRNHPKTLSTIHKILLYSCRNKYTQKCQEVFPNFSSPDDYQIPEAFLIDGCYIRSMNSLMEFTNSDLENVPHKSLGKLIQFRKNILNDIDQYYIEKNGETCQLELNAEIQIQIIRFIVGKLKGWAIQIYSQLKFLEYFYGDEEIAYKYQEASFMYTQLIMAFQIVGFE